MTSEPDRDADLGLRNDGELQSESNLTKCRKYLPKFNKLLTSFIYLFFFLMVYSVLGALIFQAIEGPRERWEKKRMSLIRQRFIIEMWNLTQTKEKLSEKWKDFVTKSFPEYEMRIVEYTLEGYLMDENEESWTIFGAILFCLTIYTTIGYGTVTAKTEWGRVLTLFYAIIGVPLAMLALTNLGKKIENLLTVGWLFVRRYCASSVWRAAPSPSQTNANTSTVDTISGTKITVSHTSRTAEPNRLPVVIALLILFFYMLLGTVMYSFLEKWGVINSFYFVVVSLITIGFGDISPMKTNYFIFTSMYIILGLALASMFINVSIHTALETFSGKLDKAKESLHKVVSKNKNAASEAAQSLSIKLKEF